MISLTRRVHVPQQGHPHVHVTEGGGRPCQGGAPVLTGPLASGPGLPGTPYAGMDPSNPATYVRPWNPVGGMISYLNYDGAAVQERQPTGLQRGRQQRKRGYR